MAKLIAILLGIALLLAVAFGLSVILAYPVKWLWNDLVPGLFHMREISIGEAWELSFLCSLLFKSSTSSTSSSSD